MCERERERKREKKKKKDTANRGAAPSEHQVSPKPNGPQRAKVNQHVQQKHQQWRQPSSGKCITDLKHGNGVTLKAPLEHTGPYNSASIDPLLCALAVPWAGKSAWQHHGYHQHAPMQEPGLTTTGRSRYCCKDPCVPRLLATEGPSFSCHI